jgi:hypothetical protein
VVINKESSLEQQSQYSLLAGSVFTHRCAI